jgi:hypothetical protein
MIMNLSMVYMSLSDFSKAHMFIDKLINVSNIMFSFSKTDSLCYFFVLKDEFMSDKDLLAAFHIKFEIYSKQEDVSLSLIQSGKLPYYFPFTFFLGFLKMSQFSV